MTWTTRMMSDKHEDDLAWMFAGRKTAGSGNQWRDQMDGKQPHGSGDYVFAWDGKSTLGKSVGVTRDMWNKAIDQTQAWEIPVVPLRFYGNERLTQIDLDLAVIDAKVLASLQSDANEVVAQREWIVAVKVCLEVGHTWVHGSDCVRCGVETR